MVFMLRRIPKTMLRLGDSLEGPTSISQLRFITTGHLNRILMKMSRGKEHLGQAREDPGIGFWVSLPVEPHSRA